MDRLSEGGFRRRIVRPLVDLLRQGATPERLALSVALGAALGIFPVLGTTTALCALAALVLRLNLPAIQIANYALYPLQILLILPFSRLGELLFRTGHHSLSRTKLVAIVHSGFLQSLEVLWSVILHAVAGWALAAPLLGCGLYIAMVPLFRKLSSRAGRESDS